ncbi:MAG: efflux RND transporter periplasmic adaptor subunit [Candidatus Competibacteraceae bacterium]|nr:efflux RND transporter periplasmic adaptor subunit [Candidatus Competibacteraceae bacterium]
MRRLIIVIILFALVGLAYWYWTQPKPISVVVRPVETGLVEATVANTRAGTVKACRRAKLSLPSGGQVDRLLAREGDRVTAKQILMELWNEDLRAQLSLAQSQLAASRARTEESCLLAEMAKREANRLKPLKARGLVSTERLDQADTEAQSKAAACNATTASVHVSEAQVAVARAALERTMLRAPFAGVIAEVTGEIGEYVTPSPPGIATPPAVDLIDYSCVYISAPIDEVDAPAIQVDMPARITLDAFPSRVFQGRVRRIAPYVLDLEKQARTVEVEAEITGNDHEQALLPGYSADLEVILDARPAALRIPSEAVLEGNQVLVLGDDGILQERTIVPGLRNWSYTQVQDGLQEGERIVVSVERAGVKAGATASAEP